MSRWYGRVRSALGASRAPAPVVTRTVTTPTAPRVAVVGPEVSSRDWLAAALALPDDDNAVVIDARKDARPAPDFVARLANLIAVERGSDVDAGRWIRLTGLPGSILRFVDIPAGIANARSVVILSEPRGPSGVARLWLDVVHPNTAVRARALRGDGAVELAAWMPATWILRWAAGPGALIAVTRSAVMAELVAFGIARLAERDAGIEAITPWEEPGVQRLFELQLQPSDAGTTIRTAGGAASDSAQIARLAETIGAIVGNELGGTPS